MKVAILVAVAMLIATAADASDDEATVTAANTPGGTSFNFEGIQYTFYPGQTAVNFVQAQAFCLSKGKDLAMFDLRSQLKSASDYISAEGGVWTNYRTDKDAAFATADKKNRNPWNEEFAVPNCPERSSLDANKCGLLSLVDGDAGIAPTDCETKKAALCSLQPTVNPVSKQKSVESSNSSPETMKPTSARSSNSISTNASTVETTPQPMKHVDDNKTEPILLTVEGTIFTYYAKVIQFGGWTEACQFCADHNQQAAVFSSFSQLKRVLTELNAKSFWTGYSTDGNGQIVSVDSAAPWITEFAIDAIAAPKAMCGSASIVMRKKYGIRWQPCVSQRTVLCSAKNQ